MDPRTWSITNGVLFVEMSGLLGLSVRAEAVLRNPQHLEKVRQHGQVIFVWTDEQNDRQTVQHLKVAQAQIAFASPLARGGSHM